MKIQSQDKTNTVLIRLEPVIMTYEAKFSFKVRTVKEKTSSIFSVQFADKTLSSFCARELGNWTIWPKLPLLPKSSASDPQDLDIDQLMTGIHKMMHIETRLSRMYVTGSPAQYWVHILSSEFVSVSPLI